MRRDSWVSLFVVLVVAVVAVLAWRAAHRHPRSITRTETTVLVAPPATPLRDAGPKNNPGTQTTRRSGSSRGVTVGGPQSPTPGTQNRSLPSRKRQAPKTTPTPRPSSQGAPPPSQPSSPQPSPPPPVVGVTVPAPVTVCARPVATVNC